MSAVDVALLARHDRPGPRYTSYPTAVEFTAGFGPADQQRMLEASRDAGRPLSLYVHQPYCRSLCWFCACSVVITHAPARIDAYLGLLEQELAIVAPLAGEGRPFEQLHWGGGTPSYLDPAQMRRLMGALMARFTPAPGAEISVEVDPRELDRERMATLVELGVNRISMGVQDVDANVQRAINRIQPEAMTRQAVETARELGIRSVNLDLVYGLPEQTLSRFGATVDAVLALRPERIALYSFAYVPWLKKHHQVLATDAMPAPAEKLEIFKMATDRLIDAGYVYLGMDHFALPTDELALALADGTLQRNFQGYSTRAGTDIVGLGLTSIGQTDASYAQNHKHLGDYRAAVEAGRLPTQRGVLLTDDDRLRRDVIMALMCADRVRYADIEAQHGIDFRATFAAELAALPPLADDGLVVVTDEAIELTPAGRLLIRNVAMTFDAYRRSAPTRPTFSRTI